jgi:hypothetical protein
MDSFTKQPSEEFYIAGGFTNVLQTGETIVEGSSTVTAVDTSDDSDASTIVLEQATKTVDGVYLKMQCKAGENNGKYKITFRASTSDGNLFEVDVLMRVKEI